MTFDSLECLEPNSKKLTRFINCIDNDFPISIFLNSSPIMNTIDGLKIIKLTILINYRNKENEFKFNISYPSHLSQRDDGHCLKNDTIWLKEDELNIPGVVDVLIFSFPKLLIAKDLFYDFFSIVKNS